MRKSLIFGAAGAAGAVAVASVVLAGTAFASPQPHRGPIAPGRSVTATLENLTSCTLQLTGGTVPQGHLTQDVPLTIAPHSAGTWKITGANAFGNDAADVAVVFAVTGCAQAGSEEGYAMQNTDDYGLRYRDDACAVDPAPGLQNTFTAVAAYHATLTIDLTATATGAASGMAHVRPQLGSCGGLPLA
jgi:hypothetical protein